MYQPSEVDIIGLLETEFPKLDDQLKDPDSPLNEYLSGYSATEKDNIKKEYRKVKQHRGIFMESFPHEPANLPAIVVEERDQTETEHFLGTMGDIEEDEGTGKVKLTSQFVFRKTVAIEVVTKNKDATKHLTVLIKWLFLVHRLTFEAKGMRQQRIQAVNGITREVTGFPEEAFVRTIIFSFTTDEEVQSITEVPVITALEPIHREKAA